MNVWILYHKNNDSAMHMVLASTAIDLSFSGAIVVLNLTAMKNRTVWTLVIMTTIIVAIRALFEKFFYGKDKKALEGNKPIA